MFLLCCYDVMFTLETKNIQHEVFFGLRDLSVMLLCRKCEAGLTLHNQQTWKDIHCILVQKKKDDIGCSCTSALLELGKMEKKF